MVKKNKVVTFVKVKTSLSGIKAKKDKEKSLYENHYDWFAGILPSKGKAIKALLRERGKDTKIEDRRS